MANVSDIKQLVKNDITNEVNNQLDINLSNNCLASTDASQTIENLKLQGVTDVDITQRNNVQNMCNFKTLLDMNIIQSMTAQSQSNLLDKLNSTVGIGAAVSSKNQEIINNVKNTSNTKAFIDASSKCIQQSLQTQNIKNVTIQDSKNIKLGQINNGINSCITNAAQQVGITTETKTTSESKAESESTLKGFDPLASLGNLFGGLAAFGILGALSPIISICCCILLCVGLVMLLGGGLSAGKGSGDAGDSGIDMGDGIDVGDAYDAAGGISDTASNAKGVFSSALSLVKKGGGNTCYGDACNSVGATDQMVGRTFLIIDYIGRSLLGIDSK